MATKLVATNAERAVSRAAAYSLLAYALAYPDDAVIEGLHEAAAEASILLAQTPLAGLGGLAVRLERDDLEPAYVSLYTLSSSPDCPTFETAYFSADPQQQTQRMADVAGFYRAFGVDSGETGFRPDEISVELEFMAYLCRKQAYAAEHLGAPRAGQALRAQRLFLEEHLGRWAGGLGRRMAEEAPIGHFYQLAGLVLSEWIADDCRVLGARPEEVSGVPVASDAGGTSHGPEFAGPANPIFAFDEIPIGGGVR
jgi:DMSO reductase family type II enzyme chaperone